MPFDADALIQRFTERNKDAIAKPQLTEYPASISLKLLAKSADEAADILKTLCSNLERFSDIAEAEGGLL